jgi:hypothetical protein
MPYAATGNAGADGFAGFGPRDEQPVGGQPEDGGPRQGAP